MSQTGRDWKKMWSIATFYLWLALLLFPDSFPRGQCLSVSNDIFRVTLNTCEWTIQKVSRVNGIVIGMKWNKECIAGEKYPVVPSPLGGVTILWLKCLYHFDTLPSCLIWCWKLLKSLLCLKFERFHFDGKNVQIDVGWWFNHQQCLAIGFEDSCYSHVICLPDVKTHFCFGIWHHLK